MKRWESGKVKAGKGWGAYRLKPARAMRMDEDFEYVDQFGVSHAGKAGQYLVLNTRGDVLVAEGNVFESMYEAVE